MSAVDSVADGPFTRVAGTWPAVWRVRRVAVQLCASCERPGPDRRAHALPRAPEARQVAAGAQHGPPDGDPADDAHDRDLGSHPAGVDRWPDVIVAAVANDRHGILHVIRTSARARRAARRRPGWRAARRRPDLRGYSFGSPGPSGAADAADAPGSTVSIGGMSRPSGCAELPGSGSWSVMSWKS